MARTPFIYVCKYIHILVLGAWAGKSTFILALCVIHLTNISAIAILGYQGHTVVNQAPGPQFVVREALLGLRDTLIFISCVQDDVEALHCKWHSVRYDPYYCSR